MLLRFSGVALFIQVGDGNVRPFFCECIGHGAPDATVASRNQRGFPFELAAAFGSGVFGNGQRIHQVFHPRLARLVLRREGEPHCAAFFLCSTVGVSWIRHNNALSSVRIR